MIRHIFKLVWNRRRSSALILTEILISFLVLCAVLSVAANFALNWRKPLGFDIDNVWRVRVSFGRYSVLTDDERRGALTQLEQLRMAVAELDEVEHIAYVGNTPYSNNTNSSVPGMRLSSAFRNYPLATMYLFSMAMYRLPEPKASNN